MMKSRYLLLIPLVTLNIITFSFIYLINNTSKNSNILGITKKISSNLPAQCPIAPSPAYNPVPYNKSIDVEYLNNQTNTAIKLKWSHDNDWGEVCSSRDDHYSVYGSIQDIGIACPLDKDSYYDQMAGCEYISSSVTECSSYFYQINNKRVCWFVRSSNGEEYSDSDTSLQSPGIWWFETESPVSAINWFTTVGGSVYGYLVKQALPENSAWGLAYTVYSENILSPDKAASSALITSYDIDLESEADYYPASQSDLWAKYVFFDKPWITRIQAYNGVPPENAIKLPTNITGHCSQIFKDDSNKIGPQSVYYIEDPKCASEAVNSVDGVNGYSMKKEGTVVIYVKGTGDFVFEHPFITNNENYRILFVTGPEVTVRIRDMDDSIGSFININDAKYPSPDKIKSFINASFIVSQQSLGYIVEGTQDPEDDPDSTTFIGTGPIISKNILLNKNRGADNENYPSEIFIYDHGYLYSLTSDERKSNKANVTGLFTTSIF